MRPSTSKLRSRHRKWVQVIENEDNYIYFEPDAECTIYSNYASMIVWAIMFAILNALVTLARNR